MLARSRRRLAATLAVAMMLALAAPALASAAYAAIAVNRSTAAWGVAYRAPAKWYAERQALRKCPGECKVIAWVFDQCAAVVQNHTQFVAGAGPGKLAAIKDARRRAHDHQARFIAWVCSD
jgi:hypothetical protein